MSQPLTERDLDLIEIALESAVSACVPLSPGSTPGRAINDLADEYQHALDSFPAWRQNRGG